MTFHCAFLFSYIALQTPCKRSWSFICSRITETVEKRTDVFILRLCSRILQTTWKQLIFFSSFFLFFFSYNRNGGKENGRFHRAFLLLYEYSADAMETELKLLTFLSCVSVVVRVFCRRHGNRAEVADVFIVRFCCTSILQTPWKQSWSCWRFHLSLIHISEPTRPP